MPFGANTQGGNLGPASTVAQPGPSPGTFRVGRPVAGGITGTSLPVVFAWVANALACRRPSGRFHLRLSNVGVAVQGPIWSLPEIFPPRAQESWLTLALLPTLD